jgi:hypothetical protein
MLGAMDIESCKIERGRRRVRSLKMSKKNRHKRRSGSENGRAQIGNSKKGSFCSYCKPTLANSLARKFDAKNVVTQFHKESTSQHNCKEQPDSQTEMLPGPYSPSELETNKLSDHVLAALKTYQHDEDYSISYSPASSSWCCSSSSSSSSSSTTSSSSSLFENAEWEFI